MKTRQAFCLPLSSQAVDVLKQMRAFDYVDSRTFFGGGEGNMLSGASLSHVIRELGFGGTCHGFRSLLFSWALEQGYPHDVADTQLAHAIGSQTSRSYSGASRDGKRLLADFMEQRARMMQHWGDVVEVAEAGKPLDVGGNVVKLKRARQGI